MAVASLAIFEVALFVAVRSANVRKPRQNARSRSERPRKRPPRIGTEFLATTRRHEPPDRERPLAENHDLGDEM